MPNRPTPSNPEARSLPPRESAAKVARSPTTRWAAKETPKQSTRPPANRPTKPPKKRPTKRTAKPATKPPTKPSRTQTPKARALTPSGQDWRDETLAHVRGLILEADPAIVEEVKWRKPSNAMQGVPAWSRDGIVCTGETYKDKVKLTFPKGASLEDPACLFNAGDGGTRRAIDLHEGQQVNARAFKALVRAAVTANRSTRQG